MKYNTDKKKENRIAGFCKKVLIPSFAGAVYGDYLPLGRGLLNLVSAD